LLIYNMWYAHAAKVKVGISEGWAAFGEDAANIQHYSNSSKVLLSVGGISLIVFIQPPSIPSLSSAPYRL